jgi:hypothetical protein
MTANCTLYLDLQVGLQIFVLPKSLWPDTLFTRREDAIGVDCVFDRFDETAVSMIIEIIQRGDAI